MSPERLLQVLILTATFFVAACSGTRPPVPETPQPQATDREAMACLSQLRSGDVLLRAGNDEISKVFRFLNTRDQRYSHAGIVILEAGEAFVYHSIGGADNPRERLRRDPVPAFVRRARNTGFALIRYDLDTAERQQLLDLVRSYYKNGLRFDNNFDLASDSNMYCTEFVYKLLLRATGDTAYLGRTMSDRGPYIAVDDLFNNKHSQTICELHYK